METLQGFDVVRSAPTAVKAARADESQLPTMDVRFSALDVWYEIDSVYEGRFLERTVRGAFARAINAWSGAKQPDSPARDIKVLFNHGFDPQIGDKVLGPIRDMREDDDAAVGVVELLDTSYNRDLIPGLQAGVYGSSMRMVVTKDEWNDSPGKSKHNPDGIPERTIKEVRLLEFGPVTFPANPESTANMRSTTDSYYERLRSRDPQRVDAVDRARSQIRTPDDGPAQALRADGPAQQEPSDQAEGHSSGLTPAQRREALYPYLTKE